MALLAALAGRARQTLVALAGQTRVRSIVWRQLNGLVMLCRACDDLCAGAVLTCDGMVVAVEAAVRAMGLMAAAADQVQRQRARGES